MDFSDADLYVRIDCLRSSTAVEDFQNLISLSEQEFDSFNLTTDLSLLLPNLLLIKKRKGIRFCNSIFDQYLKSTDLSIDNVLASNLMVIKKALGNDKAKKVVEQILSGGYHYLLLPYFDIVKDIYGNQGIDKCREIVTYISDGIHSKSLSLLSYPDILRAVYGDQKWEQEFKAIITEAMKSYMPDVIIGCLPQIKQFYGDQGVAKCKAIVEHFINLYNGCYIDKLVHQLDFIKSIYGDQGIEKCKEIVDTSLERRKYNELLAGLRQIKQIYGDQGIKICDEIIDAEFNRHHFVFLIKFLPQIKQFYGNQGVEKCREIVDAALEKGAHDVLKKYSPQVKHCLYSSVELEEDWHAIVLFECEASSEENLSNDALQVLVNNFTVQQYYSSSKFLRFYLGSQSERMVRNVNRLHNSRDSIRFSSLKDKSVFEMYVIMVHGEAEMYTSTFNGIFNRFLLKVKNSAFELLQSVNFSGFRTFIKLCVTYGRLDDFLKTMSQDNAKVLLEKTINNLDEEDNYLHEFTAVSEIIGGSAGKYKEVFSELLLENYQRVLESENQNSVILYGLLITTFISTLGINEGELFEISKNYKMRVVQSLDTSDMFIDDPEKRGGKLNVQMHLFYYDKDANSSFKHFLAKQPRPKVETNEYVIIEKSVGERKVRMYVTKPGKDREMVDRNLEEVKAAMGDLPVHMLVHRGHSYHVGGSLPSIDRNTKLVFLGSCGGYTRVGDVLNRSANAQIISTKGTGAMAINRPLLNSINDQLLNVEEINWASFWTSHGKRHTRGKAKDRWQLYVSPHRNFAMMYLRAYREMKRS